MIKLGNYRHFRGGIYKVIGTGIDSETDTMYVIYHNIDSPDQLYLRREQNFTQELPSNIDGAGELVPRFQYEEELNQS